MTRGKRRLKLSRRSKYGLAGIALAVATFSLVGWALLFNKPTLPIPRFLAPEVVSSHESTYREDILTKVRKGQELKFPATVVTENIHFKVGPNFDAAMDRAQGELTSARGWDLGALPRDKIARFYQRSTNTTVSVFLDNRQTKVVVSQTRYASVADRMRRWWQELRS